MPVTHNVRTYRDEISLAEWGLGILRFYRVFGILLLLLAGSAAVAAGCWMALHPLFSVTAILETPELTLDKWRRIEPLLSDRYLVTATTGSPNAALGNAIEGAAGSDSFATMFLQPSFWENSVHFRAALRRDDIQETPNVDLRNASTLGLEISLVARNEEQAANKLDSIIRQIREAMLWSRLHEYLQQLGVAIANEHSDLEIKLIKQQFAIEQDQGRIGEMRQLLDSYPELRQINANTVVSVQDGGGKYLSPLTQIVALEVTISAANAEIRAARRDIERLDWYDRLLKRMTPQMPDIHTGSQLVTVLAREQQALFGSPATLSSAAQQAYRELDNSLANALRSNEMLRLKALPALSSRPIRSHQPMLVAVLTFVLVLASLSLILAIYRALRQSGMPQGQKWSAYHDPLFSVIPARLRALLLPHAHPCASN